MFSDRNEFSIDKIIEKVSLNTNLKQNFSNLKVNFESNDLDLSSFSNMIESFKVKLVNDETFFKKLSDMLISLRIKDNKMNLSFSDKSLLVTIFLLFNAENYFDFEAYREFYIYLNPKDVEHLTKMKDLKNEVVSNSILIGHSPKNEIELNSLEKIDKEQNVRIKVLCSNLVFGSYFFNHILFNSFGFANEKSQIKDEKVIISPFSYFKIETDDNDELQLELLNNTELLNKIYDLNQSENSKIVFNDIEKLNNLNNYYYLKLIFKLEDDEPNLLQKATAISYVSFFFNNKFEIKDAMDYYNIAVELFKSEFKRLNEIYSKNVNSSNTSNEQIIIKTVKKIAQLLNIYFEFITWFFSYEGKSLSKGNEQELVEVVDLAKEFVSNVDEKFKLFFEELHSIFRFRSDNAVLLLRERNKETNDLYFKLYEKALSYEPHINFHFKLHLKSIISRFLINLSVTSQENNVTKSEFTSKAENILKKIGKDSYVYAILLYNKTIICSMLEKDKVFALEKTVEIISKVKVYDINLSRAHFYLGCYEKNDNEKKHELFDLALSCLPPDEPNDEIAAHKILIFLTKGNAIFDNNQEVPYALEVYQNGLQIIERTGCKSFNVEIYFNIYLCYKELNKDTKELVSILEKCLNCNGLTFKMIFTVNLKLGDIYRDNLSNNEKAIDHYITSATSLFEIPEGTYLSQEDKEYYVDKLIEMKDWIEQKTKDHTSVMEDIINFITTTK